MPASESQKDDARLAAETTRIKAAYARRQCGDLYSWFNPGQLFLLARSIAANSGGNNQYEPKE